jgi:hypothetical protein
MKWSPIGKGVQKQKGEKEVKEADMAPAIASERVKEGLNEGVEEKVVGGKEEKNEDEAPKVVEPVASKVEEPKAVEDAVVSAASKEEPALIKKPSTFEPTATEPIKAEEPVAGPSVVEESEPAKTNLPVDEKTDSVALVTPEPEVAEDVTSAPSKISAATETEESKAELEKPAVDTIAAPKDTTPKETETKTENPAEETTPAPAAIPTKTTETKIEELEAVPEKEKKENVKVDEEGAVDSELD